MATKPSYEELEQRIQQLEKKDDAHVNAGRRSIFLSYAVNQSSEGIAICDLDGNLIYVNDAFARMHGHSPGNLIGENLSVFHTREQMPSVEAANQQIKKTGEFKGEIWHVRRDGTVFPAMMHNSLVRDNTGKPMGMIGTMRDITDVKESEQALKESEKKYRTLFNHFAEGVYLHDVDGRILDVNKAAVLQSGYSKDELLRLNVFDLHPDQSKREDILQQWRRWIPDHPTTLETRHRRKDGTVHPVEVTTGKVHYENRVLLLAIVQDITERKEAEAALKERVKELNCLYGISHIVESGKTLSQIIQDTANLVPDSWKYPEVAICRLTLNGDVFSTQKICEESCDDCSHAFISQNIFVYGNPAGEIRVCYTQEKPDADEGPFLREERKLLDAIAEALGRIVEHRHAQEALRKSQMMLARTESIANIGSWEWEIATDTVTWSEELYRIFQLDPDGSAPSWAEHPKLYHPEDFENLKQAAGKAMADGTPYTLELRAFRKDGEIRVCLARGFPEMNSEGRVVRLFGSLQDITEYKRAEEALQRSKEKYQDLVENLNDVIFSVDASGMITYVSPRIEDLFGYTPEELIQSRFTHFLHPDDLNLIRRAFEDVLRGQQYSSEYRIRDKNGRYHWVRTSSRPIRESGQVVGLHGVLTDITDRKNAEQALRESEFKFRKLFDMSPQAIALTDLETGRLIDVNDKFCELTQYAKEALIGRTTVEAGFYTEADRRVFINELQSSGAVNGLEMNFKTKDGTMLTALMFANIINIVEKPLILTVFFDVTTLKALEDQLRQARKMQAVGTLAGGIAHEFNNILAIVLGNTDLALMEIPEWNPLRTYLEEVQSASLRARDVVRHILSFARKTPVEPKPLQISLVVEEAMKLMRATIPAEIEIRQDILCDAELVFADPTEIHQVIMNLCTNATHAMAGSDGVLTVRLEPVRLDKTSAFHYEEIAPGDFVQLTVKDTGSGMAPEILDRIFEPFFTTKGVGKGTGMGLAVVYGIVKKYGGAVKVTSEPVKGSVFEVLLPQVEGPAKQEAEKNEKLPAGSERILFVDDEESITKLVTRILGRQGYHVEGLTDSLEALERFRAEPDAYDLVISDMAMPYMAGDRLAQELMRIRRDLPVILCTGHSERIDEAEAKAIGIKAFVVKPVSATELGKTVRKVLDEAKG